MPTERPTIILFISKESATYHFVVRQVELVCAQAYGSTCQAEIQIIDIAERPDLAEKHNIEALPTLVVGTKRCVGTPTPELLASFLGITPQTAVLK